MKTASYVPLIGGMPIAVENVFGKPPNAIISVSAFENNEKHLMNWYKSRGLDIPYYQIDKNQKPTEHYDVIESTCPCAGLSLLSQGYGDHNPNNRYMLEGAEYVLSELRPTIYFAENAPALVTKIGKNIRETLIKIAKKHGYTCTFYVTKSLLHGVPQVRSRTFYFFWKGDRVPLLNYYNRPLEKIEDLIVRAHRESNFQTELISEKVPSEDPWYSYILNVIHGGISHREFWDIIPNTRQTDVKHYIEEKHGYPRVAEWMTAHGQDHIAKKALRAHEKLSKGENIMRREVTIPKHHIGAFVGYYPSKLTHPYEDRFLSYREAMTIMGMPKDYELLNPKKNVNHICLSGSSKILLEDGSKIKIEDLVLQKKAVKVPSLTPDGKFVYSQVTDFIVNEDHGKKWIEVKSFLNKLVCTSDHPIAVVQDLFLPKIEFLEAKDIENCHVIRIPNTLKGSDSRLYNRELLGALIGNILGDGYINKLGQLIHNHCDSQYEYILEKQRLYGGKLVRKIATGTKNFSKPESVFYSLTSPVNAQLKELRELFYRTGKKVVTKELLQYLNDAGLAFWIMDDGHLSKNKCYSLATAGFSKEENEIIRDFFIERWNICPRIDERTSNYKNDKKLYYRLLFNVSDSKKISDIIKEYVVPCMRYKVLDKDCIFKQVDSSRLDYAASKCKIKALTDHKSKLYDITVDVTHNFIADGIVVHNCQNVPVKTAEDMAREVLAVLKGERPWVDADVVFQYNTRQEHIIHNKKVNTLDDFYA